MPNSLTDFDIDNFLYLNGTVPDTIGYDVISQLSSYSIARASRQTLLFLMFEAASGDKGNVSCE